MHHCRNPPPQDPSGLNGLLLVCIVEAALAIAFAWLYLAYRGRLYAVLCRDRNFPIRTVELADFDARFMPGPLGISPSAEVLILPATGKVLGGTNEREAWILAAFSRGARRMFEFGTATGRTTYMWARNSPPDAVVGTITLSPDMHRSYLAAHGDDGGAVRDALAESRFDRFVFTGTNVEHKVRQYFGDSKEFDETDWIRRCDLVFVDGSHARSHVESDTAKAMRMVKAGGVVLWHDYRGRRGPGRDVYRVLNQLARRITLVRLTGTRLVAWRAPSEPAAERAAALLELAAD